MHGTDRHVREAFAAGARGYVLKSDPVALVEAAVEALSHHHPYFTPGIADTILGGLQLGEAEGWADESATMMTAREREILQMLAEGQSNKQIAQMLAISGKTVESHRSAIMRKHQFESLAELTLYAIRCGLVEP
jgi:DNA-binding NarL/FixJ family response regulator